MNMYIKGVLVCVCVSAAAAIWVEPAVKGSLSAEASVSGSQHAGTEVTYTCTSNGLPHTQNIYWRHQKGSVTYDTWVRGTAPLPYRRAVRPDDGNTALYCDALYSSLSADADPADVSATRRQYRAVSPPVQIFVAGGVPTTPSPALLSRSVEMSSSVPLSGLRVGDQVMLGCNFSGFTSSWIDVFQIKDDLELQMDAFRTWNVTTEDDGTSLYCRVWLDGDFITSPRVHISLIK